MKKLKVSIDLPKYPKIDGLKIGNFGIGHFWGICEKGNHIYFDLVGEPCRVHEN